MFFMMTVIVNEKNSFLKMLSKMKIRSAKNMVLLSKIFTNFIYINWISDNYYLII